jgi:CheY-like chemotaxis protein
MVIAMDLQMTLDDLDYQVISVVATGEEAIEELERSSVDLVLMDLRLAGTLDGIDTAKIVRERFNIPVVFVTAANDAEMRRLQGSIDPCEHVAKPFRVERLLTAVDKAIKRDVIS